MKHSNDFMAFRREDASIKEEHLTHRDVYLIICAVGKCFPNKLIEIPKENLSNLLTLFEE